MKHSENIDFNIPGAIKPQELLMEAIPEKYANATVSI